MIKTKFFLPLIAACTYLIPLPSNAQDAQMSIPTSTAQNITTSHQNAHKFSFRTIDGKEMKLSDMKGKTMLVVNTASKCGFTPQYAGLQNLHEKYADKGLVVIGVPSGDFAGQEFSQEQEVQEFTEKNFKITFPLTQIEHVKGKNAHPFYQWANNQGGFLSGPKWNFHKYLIDKNGDFVKGFSSATKPESDKIIKAIEQQLSDH